MVGITRLLQFAEGVSVTPPTVDTFTQSGFVDPATSVTITFTDATRTVAIAPTSVEYYYYQKGVRITNFTTKSKQITATEGQWYFYFDSTNTAQATQSFSTLISDDYNIIFAAAYWDASNAKFIFKAYEYHTNKWSRDIWIYEHLTSGTKYISGLALGNLLVDQDGSLNTHAQCSVATGVIRDEDLSWTIAAYNAPANIPVIYRSGLNGPWRLDAATAYPFKMGATRPAINTVVGSTWSQTEVTNTNFCLSLIVATNCIDCPLVAIQGQTQYNTITLARSGANDEINTIITASLPFTEWTPVATLIIECKDSFANTVNAAFRTTATGSSYVSWLGSKYSPSATPSSHSSLSGLTNDDHKQYLLLAGRSTDTTYYLSGDATTDNSWRSVNTAGVTTIEKRISGVWTTIYTFNPKDFKFGDGTTTGDRSLTVDRGGTNPAIKWNETTDKWQFSNDGSAYSNFGSGGGDYDFLSTKVLGDYVFYDEGASAVPVDATGNNARTDYLTIAASIAPLTNQEGKLNLRLSKASGDAQGQGFAVAWDSRGLIDKGAMRTVKVNSLSSANYLDGDLGIFLYDTDNSVLIYPSDQRLFGSSFASNQQFEFQLPSNSDSFKLCFHVTSATSGAWDVDFVVSIVETKYNKGGIITDWKSATSMPVLKYGTTTATNTTSNTCKLSRIGDSVNIEMVFNFNGAANADGNITITLPDNLVVDTSKIAQAAIARPLMVELQHGGKFYFGQVFFSTSTTFIIYETSATGITATAWYGSTTAGSNVPGGGSMSSDLLRVSLSNLPIVGWSSNTLLSEDAGCRMICCTAVRGSGSNQTGIATNNSAIQLQFNSVSSPNIYDIGDTVGFYDINNYCYNIYESGIYNIDIAILLASTNVLANYYGLLVRAGSSFAGGIDVAYKQIAGIANTEISIAINKPVKLTRGDKIYAGLYGNGNNGTNTLSLAGDPKYSYFSISKLSSPQQIPASEKISAQYYISASTANTSIANTAVEIVDFDTKVWDSHSAVTTGASWKFAAPRNDIYRVSASPLLLSVADQKVVAVFCYKGGNLYISGGAVNASGSSNLSPTFSSLVYLVKEEYIDIRIYNGDSSARDLDNSTGPKYNISIESI